MPRGSTQTLNAMERAIFIFKLLFQALLGVCYVKFLRDVMNFYIGLFVDAITGLDKVLNVGIAVLVTSAGIFLANHYLFKTSPKLLGIFMGVAAFIYFYIVHPAGSTFLLLIQTVMYWPSLVNMFLIVGVPIVVGFAFNKCAQYAPSG